MRLPWHQKPKKRRGVQPSPRYSNRRQVIIGLGLMVGIVVVVSVVYHVTRIPSWQITTVTVVGGTTIPATTIEQATWEALTGSYYRLIPKTFSPLYAHDGVIGRLQQIDRIKQVELDRTGRQTLTVIFTEHIPAGLWCSSVTSTDCQFLDQTGYAFGPAPRLEGSSFVRYVDSGLAPEKRVVGFGSDFMRTQREFIELLETELDLFVTHVIVVGDFDIEYVVAGGGRLKVSQTQELQSSLSNLESILTAPEFEHLRDGDFQYIDLRFGDKVFVNEVLPVTATGTATVTLEYVNVGE